VKNVDAIQESNGRRFLRWIKMHLPIRDDRNTFPALRTAFSFRSRIFALGVAAQFRKKIMTSEDLVRVNN